jgi:hypothetical protein
MVKEDVEFKESLDEALQEVTSNKVHIKTVGKILLNHGINNMKNIQNMSIILRKKGIDIIKG